MSLAIVAIAMTVSLDKLRHNFNDALIRMTEDVGEASLYELDFETKSDRFKHILATTWDELMECAYTKWRWQDTYNLTVEGWTEGMILLERRSSSYPAALVSASLAANAPVHLNTSRHARDLPPRCGPFQM